MRNGVFSWEPQHAREKSCLCLLICSAGILDHTPKMRRWPQPLVWGESWADPTLLCTGALGAGAACSSGQQEFLLRHHPFRAASFTCGVIFGLGERRFGARTGWRAAWVRVCNADRAAASHPAIPGVGSRDTQRLCGTASSPTASQGHKSPGNGNIPCRNASFESLGGTK